MHMRAPADDADARRPVSGVAWWWTAGSTVAAGVHTGTASSQPATSLPRGPDRHACKMWGTMHAMHGYQSARSGWDGSTAKDSGGMHREYGASTSRLAAHDDEGHASVGRPARQLDLPRRVMYLLCLLCGASPGLKPPWPRASFAHHVR